MENGQDLCLVVGYIHSALLQCRTCEIIEQLKLSNIKYEDVKKISNNKVNKNQNSFLAVSTVSKTE